MSLSDLDQNRSMITIVDIVGMELMNDTLISGMCKALSESINHITISQIEMSPSHYDFINGKRNRIFTLINSLPDSTQIVIRDSEFVGLNEQKIAVGDKESLPPMNFNAPLLDKVTWTYRHPAAGDTRNVLQYREEDFIFLRNTRELKLSHFFQPPHKTVFHRLTKLCLKCNREASDVERVFPSLKELVVSLSFCPERVPLIKAENLESLEVIVGRQFRVDSIIPTIRRYPKLEVFSFKNCGCSFLTRRRVEIMIYWMRWRTPCNLKEVRCGKSRLGCCFWGFFGF
jgi:hypothetical protein